MNRWGALAFLLAIAAALALRIPNLSLRPLHNDEAVNAIKVSELWQQGRYRYDPDEYHGPSLHYAAVPFLALSGAKNAADLKDAALRLAPLLFGVALILLLPLFHGGLHRGALVWTAFFVAVSPAMVFYSRYFIHEMLLVFFSALTLGAGWRYSQNPSPRWAALAGAGVGLMSVTKETFVLTLAAMAGALFLTGGFAALRINTRHLLIGLCVAAAFWLIFFTSFFSNAAGPIDSIRTYFPWLKRAGGHSPHIHPWHFYFQRLAWFHPVKGPIFSEALILALAAGGCFAAWRNRSPLPRYLAIFTFLLTGVYTAISYKTPWCLLNFFIGMILLAGLGAGALIGLCRSRILKGLAGIFLASLTLQLAWQAWQASHTFASDRRNPYVYAQTVPDVLNLIRKAEGLASISPAAYNTAVKVITSDGDYWPLPWYLRRFERVGWFDKLPDDPFAPIMILSADLDARLDERSGKKWIMVGYTELRPQKFLEMYVELELWKKYVATLPRAVD